MPGEPALAGARSRAAESRRAGCRTPRVQRGATMGRKHPGLTAVQPGARRAAREENEWRPKCDWRGRLTPRS